MSEATSQTNERKLQRLDDEVGEVKQDVAALKVNVASLKEEMGRGFTNLAETIREHKPQPIPLWTLFGGVVSIISLLTGFVAMRLNPIEALLGMHRDAFGKLHDREVEQAREDGAKGARIDALLHEVQTLKTQVEDLRTTDK